MSLLELEHVGKCCDRSNRHTLLRDVSLEIEAGELVAVWGTRRSGRSTLLRIAAGIEVPDSGIVRFDGRDVHERRGNALGDGIGYCRRAFRSSEGQLLLDHLTLGLVARGVPLSVAASRACAALERAEAGGCAALRPVELDGAEAVRASIARALTLEPRLLIIDEPTVGIEPTQRDSILTLLQSLAHDGVAVLVSTGDSPDLSGTRALMLSDGELHGSSASQLAEILPLRRSA
jgi:ABC-type multidrug transport system ATPase subunit